MCSFPTPAAFDHQRHLIPEPHLPPILLSRRDPTPSSTTISPAPACSFSSDATHPPPSLSRRPMLQRRQKIVPNYLPRLSITGELTRAGCSPPRRSSSPGRSTYSFHHAQIDGAV
uniref:Uncharacterized protein n=1 Tax=Triticum urartu TaxID=4572 RepID=A0A8R7TNL3_TRIUA